MGSAGPVGNPTLAEIIGGQLDSNFVTAKDTDIVFSHLAGDVCNNHMSILQLYPKLGIRQVFKNRAFHFDMFFFCHSIIWASAR